MPSPSSSLMGPGTDISPHGFWWPDSFSQLEVDLVKRQVDTSGSSKVPCTRKRTCLGRRIECTSGNLGGPRAVVGAELESSEIYDERFPSLV